MCKAPGSDRAVDFDVLDVLRPIAERRGAPPASVALAWLLSKPGVTAPIVGTTSEKDVHDTTKALTIALEDNEASAREQPYVARPMSDFR